MPLTLRSGPYRQFTAVYSAFFRAGSTACSSLPNDLPAANLAPLSGIHVSVAGRCRASPDQPSGSGGGFLEALHDPRTRAQPQLSRARQVTADIPSRERRQPRREFERAERLDQVVICSRVQAAAPVTDVSRAVSISAGAQTPAARSGRHSSKPSEPASITSRTIAAQGFSVAIHRPSGPSAATSRPASSRARLSSRAILTSAPITSTRTTRDHATSFVKTMSTADRWADVKTHIVLSRPTHHRSRTIG